MNATIPSCPQQSRGWPTHRHKARTQKRRNRSSLKTTR